MPFLHTIKEDEEPNRKLRFTFDYVALQNKFRNNSRSYNVDVFLACFRLEWESFTYLKSALLPSCVSDMQDKIKWKLKLVCILILIQFSVITLS